MQEILGLELGESGPRPVFLGGDKFCDLVLHCRRKREALALGPPQRWKVLGCEPGGV